MSLDEPQIKDGVFDAVDAGLVILGADRRIVGWNHWMTLATGLPATAVEGRTLNDLFDGQTHPRLGDAVTDAVISGVSSLLSHSLNRDILPLCTRDGRAMIHNVAVRQLTRAPARVLIQITDVTIATDRDRVLRERQNARYDAVVQSAPDAIVTLSSDGVIQMANPAAGRQFGYDPKELTGLPVTALMSSQEPWASVWEAVIRGVPLSRPVELMAFRKDGTATCLEVSASGWESDKRIFVTAILRDVNERRAAENALRQLNQTLEQRVAERTAERDRMWRLSNDVMLIARLDGTITSANPAWHSQFGWDANALVGRSLGELIVEEDRVLLRATLEALAATRRARLFEVRIRDHDGGSRQIAWNAVVTDGEMQAVGRDVTAERQAQDALAKAEEALRQSQKMEALGQLTGGIAHDFNNLLTGIIGAMDIMKRRISTGRLQDATIYMDAASASAHRAAALTHRLLAFARRQPLNPGPVDVNELILGMEDLLRRSVGEQVTLEFDLPDGLSRAVTDANQLENALLNLAINSRDAMPNGGMLRIATSDEVVKLGETPLPNQAEPGKYTVIRVTDYGIGMSPQTVSKVFDPFFTTKPIGQGTGLGLSMVYGFTRQSHGYVGIESELGVGTTISLYLPREEQRETEGRTVEVRPLEVIPEAAGETVLLVEDEPSVRLLIAEVLRELGYALIEAGSAEIAMPILASNVRLDLMITDVGLPGLNGRQLAEIGRQHRPALKVLFVTGYAEHATKRGDFLGPGMKMVTKPFSLEAVAVTVREMIESSRP
jgi:PAS domain S-box-containing protein